MFTLRFRDVVPTSVYDEFQSLVDQLKGFLSVSFNEDGTLIGSNPVLNVVPVGATQGWLTNTAPAGWLLLDGSQKNRVAYKGLFDVIGTQFGAGDGSTTFTLPDMRGRFFLGKAAAGTGSVLAETGGSLDHAHTGGTSGATAPAITGNTGSTAPGINGTTASESGHGHSGTTNAGTASIAVGDAGNVINVSPIAHTHAFTTSGTDAHSHGAGSLAVNSHLHDAGTLAVASHTHVGGTTGTNNPAYLAGNWIVFAGV